ncbi:MAG TPA: TlpA disulfide reductase family protein [Myxococcota bacterium]
MSAALALWAALAAGSLASAARAEPLELRDLAGGRVSLVRAGERALVVHFWATWCASCAEELPIVARAAAACAPHGVRVRIAAAGESASVVRAYLRAHAFAFEALRDPHGRAWRAAGGFGLPANWLRTSSGDRLVTGPRSPAEWSELLGSLGCPFAAEGTGSP